MGTFFDRYGPIIIYVHAQEEFYTEQITSGFLYDLAEEFDGYLFYLEHRYFGKSRPFEAYTMENLKYLRVDQVLADVSEFIRIIKRTFPQFADSDVLLAGGSGSGTLATWHRVKYPTETAGAWVSSGQLDMTSNVGPEFRGESGRLWRKFGSDLCYEKLEFGFKEIETLIAQKNVKRIEEAFNLCHPLDVDDSGSIGLFFHAIIRYLSGSVPSSGGIPQIEKVCQSIEPLLDGVDIIVKATDDFLSLFPCFNIKYEEFIEIERNETLDYIARPLFYIACNDLVGYKAGGSRDQPFGNYPSGEFYVQWCADVFDQEFTMESYEASGRRMNAEYGGKEVFYTNVYTTQGELDPGRVLGKERNVGILSPTDIIPRVGGSHDMFHYFYPRTSEMNDVYKKLGDLAEEWLYG